MGRSGSPDTIADLGLMVMLDTDYETAVERVTEALKVEGFGILTEIDVKSTLKKKIDVDFRPYVILGACNPPLAHRALTAAPEVGMLLPCNVTVAQNDDGQIQVSIINPLVMMQVVPNDELEEIAKEAHERLSRVVESLR